MERRRFYIVDVFAERKYAGNQLAVVRDAGGLSTEEMQLIAREMNYSETTFLLSDQPTAEGYPVRIFTLAEEVPFAGHPTLGTAYVVQRELINGVADRIVLDLPVGPIAVDWERETLWMEQIEPDFGGQMEPSAVAGVLGLEPEQIERRFPVQDVSTGFPFIICPVVDEEALDAISVGKSSILAYVADKRAKAILAFCSRKDGDGLRARVFTDYYDIPEDPATGSANGCLAAYLLAHAVLGPGSVRTTVRQGEHVQRPSLLRLRAERDDEGRIRVRVGGEVVMVAEGTLV